MSIVWRRKPSFKRAGPPYTPTFVSESESEPRGGESAADAEAGGRRARGEAGSRRGAARAKSAPVARPDGGVRRAETGARVEPRGSAARAGVEARACAREGRGGTGGGRGGRDVSATRGGEGFPRSGIGQQDDEEKRRSNRTSPARRSRGRGVKTHVRARGGGGGGGGEAAAERECGCHDASTTRSARGAPARERAPQGVGERSGPPHFSHAATVDTRVMSIKFQ